MENILPDNSRTFIFLWKNVRKPTPDPPETIPRRSQNYPKTTPKRVSDNPKMIPRRPQNDSQTTTEPLLDVPKLTPTGPKTYLEI